METRNPHAAACEADAVPTWLCRQQALIGEEGCRALGARRVMLFGLGGVGGYVAEALARCGIGGLIAVDHDRISDSNRNRQILALRATVGEEKTAVLAARIAEIHPTCALTLLPLRVTPENAESLIAAHSPDWIVDAIDDLPAKCAIARAAAQAQIPIIASMGTGNKLCPERLRVSALEQTSVCPLARVMRRAMKQEGIAGLQVLWSDELPQKPPLTEEGRVPSSISFLPPAAGLMIASVLVRAVLAKEEKKYCPKQAHPCP